MDKLSKIGIPRHLSEGFEREMGHSSAVRLRQTLRMSKLPRIEIPRHLSEGFER
jgi:hypothetical protein